MSSAYVPTASGQWSGASHIVNGVQLVPGAPGYDPVKASPWHQQIASTDRQLASYMAGSSAPAARASAAQATLTPEIARDLMIRSMTTGAPTAEFDRYGGYDAVASMYNQGGGTYSLADIPAERKQQLAQTIAQTGVGNLSLLKETNTPLTAAGREAMIRHGTSFDDNELIRRGIPFAPVTGALAKQDLSKLSLIDLEKLKGNVQANPGNYPPGYLSEILERMAGLSFVGGTEAQRDLGALSVGGLGGTTPYSPYASGPGFFFGGPSPFRDVVERPVREPLAPIFEPVGQSPYTSAPSPGFSSVTPSFYKKGGSVSKRELDSLPGYQAGGSIGFSPRARVLPSERRFMDERLGEYEAYNRQVEPYNRALEDYQSAYDRYMADVEAYNRAAEAYNAGPRTEDFAMQQPSFTAQAPQFTATAPVMPDFTPEQFQQYQQQARQRAGQRASALNTAFDRGIAPEVAQYFRRGIV